MRIDFTVFKKIEEWYGSDDFEIGVHNDKALYIRFGYWNQVDDAFNAFFPDYIGVSEFLVDEDDDTGPAYIYLIWHIDPFKYVDSKI
jgi:hypothetical protein